MALFLLSLSILLYQHLALGVLETINNNHKISMIHNQRIGDQKKPLCRQSRFRSDFCFIHGSSGRVTKVREERNSKTPFHAWFKGTKKYYPRKAMQYPEFWHDCGMV
jgi:hypothetical protein